MQKHAFERKKTIIYQPISFSDGALAYVDPAPAQLPDGDIQRLHYHDCLEIGVCLSGSSIFLFGNHVESVSQNDAFLIPPSIHHYSKVISTEPCLCAFVYLDVSHLRRTLRIENVSISELLEKHSVPVVFKHENAH
jgi:oxalate decarboxylase/phosphoglucose isomerase-like protein (cupin superfamily)